ncbi:uncharacterized protein LOC130800810 [Amaranthus tricolor]|uniref:uncharacterized protein LOC130800810 n=1 Tax=Amaranthus tricolor TaxID=29722 RepID=UPI00258D4B2A|nr:uncharacterized protein LOC130800810 [Amaranthus tricolor]
MIPFGLTLSPTTSFSLLSTTFLPKLNHIHNNGYKVLNQKLTKKQKVKLRKSGICRAELQQDAPLAIAIGACISNSYLFPFTDESLLEEEDSTLKFTDKRFFVMNLISLIPYFNWLSWVFAFSDTGKWRYAVYASVYVAPYLRSNLSIAPEDSWLPIASIVLCIIHIQLEGGESRE